MADHNRVRVVAHRGDSWAEPENTLPAFRSAIARGVDVVELDARVTADGVPVVLHDLTLGRIWGVAERVDRLTAAEVAAVSIAGVGIPTLAEALDLFTGGSVRVMVDLPSPAGVDAVLACVLDHPARPLVCWSGPEEPLRAVRAADPDAVVITHELSAADADLRPTMVNLDGSTVVADDIDRAHAAGLGVSVWTVDDADAMRWLIRHGVDSITTNRPDVLLAVRSDPDRSTSPADPELERCRGIAQGLARQAIRMQRSATGFTVETKANAADLVTEVDRSIERMVRDVLGRELPDHTVVGEEYGGTPGPGPTWYCDPVDGTTNFANGLGWSSFSLSLVRDDRIVVGVVGDTITGDVWSAVVGSGATVDGLPARSHPVRLPGSVVLTELAGADLWPGQAELFRRLAAVGSTARVMGSGTLALALPAAGRGAAGVVHRFNPIDHAASVLIAVEAGCDLLGARGEVVDPVVSALRGEMVITAAPGLSAELRPLLTGG